VGGEEEFLKTYDCTGKSTFMYFVDNKKIKNYEIELSKTNYKCIKDKFREDTNNRFNKYGE
jgi:hypothetical protein